MNHDEPQTHHSGDGDRQRSLWRGLYKSCRASSAGRTASQLSNLVPDCVQKPEEINIDEVAKQIPYGSVTVNAVHGGLDLHDTDNHTISVIASAAVEASLYLPEGRFALPVSP